MRVQRLAAAAVAAPAPAVVPLATAETMHPEPRAA